jgi:exonuclease III
MLLLSLNLRGTGGTLKSASVRRLLDRTHPDIVFLQETLVHEQKARAFMNGFRPTWVSCAVNSVGNSGGFWLRGTQTYLNWFLTSPVVEFC